LSWKIFKEYKIQKFTFKTLEILSLLNFTVFKFNDKMINLMINLMIKTSFC
jgi:hypothetical protein